MKKIIIALAAVLATALGASATNYAYTLVMNRTDGKQTEFLFANLPVATINGEEVTIVENETGLSVEVPMSEIANFTFAKKEVGVNNIKSDRGNVSFGLTKENLDVYGLAEGVRVTIFDASGRLRAEGTSSVEGIVTISVAGLDKGVYVVTAGKQTFKFIR